MIAWYCHFLKVTAQSVEIKLNKIKQSELVGRLLMQETGTGKRRNDECCNTSEKQGKSSGCIACMGQTHQIRIGNTQQNLNNLKNNHQSNNIANTKPNQV